MNEKEDGSSLANLTFCTNSTETTLLANAGNTSNSNLGSCQIYFKSAKNDDLADQSEPLKLTNAWALDSSFDEVKTLTQSSTNTQLTNVSELRIHLIKQRKDEMDPLLISTKTNNEKDACFCNYKILFFKSRSVRVSINDFLKRTHFFEFL